MRPDHFGVHLRVAGVVGDEGFKRRDGLVLGSFRKVVLAELAVDQRHALVGLRHFQAFHLDGVLFEDIDSACHGANLVAPFAVGHVDFLVAFGKLAHGFGHRLQRPPDAA